ncbi:MAG: isochorismatase family protein, partial [Yoonia sp.]|uniref:isochorismatase family protein n=1 Tax=Yoonia sp. TaxID=2212373 RepID=UPI003EF85AA1
MNTAGKNPALLIIDFQREFTETALNPLARDCDSAVQTTASFIDAFRGHGPINSTINSYAPNLSNMGRWGEKCSSLATLIRGTPTCELDPRLGHSQKDDRILHKNRPLRFSERPCRYGWHGPNATHCSLFFVLCS